MTDAEQLKHILHLQRYGYTDIRHHETHKWCGIRGNYAITGIQDDGSYMSANECSGGMAAVAYLEKLCALVVVPMAAYFGGWVIQ